MLDARVMLPTTQTTSTTNAAEPRSRDYAERYRMYVDAARRNASAGHYFRRAFRWRQMDVEYSLWQAASMCVNPKAVYRHTTYRKQTKNQWARDDPTFVVMSCVFVTVAAIGYCAMYGGGGASATARIAARCAVGDYLGLGCVLATASWYLANTYLRTKQMGGHSHAVEQRVEWMYAFDVHCNAFAPTYVVLYVLQLLLSPLLRRSGYLASACSCVMYAIALAYHNYCVFVGYNALPFLERTEFFLYPAALVLVLAPFAALVAFNPTRFVLWLYFGPGALID